MPLSASAFPKTPSCWLCPDSQFPDRLINESEQTDHQTHTPWNSPLRHGQLLCLCRTPWDCCLSFMQRLGSFSIAHVPLSPSVPLRSWRPCLFWGLEVPPHSFHTDTQVPGAVEETEVNKIGKVFALGAWCRLRWFKASSGLCWCHNIADREIHKEPKFVWLMVFKGEKSKTKGPRSWGLCTMLSFGKRSNMRGIERKDRQTDTERQTENSSCYSEPYSDLTLVHLWRQRPGA